MEGDAMVRFGWKFIQMLMQTCGGGGTLGGVARGEDKME